MKSEIRASKVLNTTNTIQYLFTVLAQCLIAKARDYEDGRFRKDKKQKIKDYWRNWRLFQQNHLILIQTSTFDL